MLTGPFGIISPHLDDAVFSCAQAIRAHPASVIVTVFAGRPQDDRLSGWDSGCGFKPGDRPMLTRRAEDQAACADLGVTPLHLPFLDREYWEPAEDDAICNVLVKEIDRLGLRTWLVPLGIKHHDHEQAHRASVMAMSQLPGRCWVIYEELPYRLQYEPETQAALEAAGGRLDLGPATVPSDPDLQAKERAICCYRTQLGKGSAYESTMTLSLTTETYWAVHSPT